MPKRKAGRKGKTGNARGRPKTPELTADDVKSIAATIYMNLCCGDTNKKPVVHRGQQCNLLRERANKRTRLALTGKLSRAKYKPKYADDANAVLANKSFSVCKRGKSHSRSQIQSMIRAVSMIIVNYKTSFTNACSFVAKMIGAGKSSVQEHCKRYFTTQTIVVTDNSRRGAGSEKYGTDHHVLKKDHLVAIQRYIDNQNLKSGGVVSTTTIQAHLMREFGRKYRIATIYYAVKVRLGYIYKKPRDLRVAMTPKRRARLRKHWLQRDLALKLEAAGKAVCVYMDESYIHQNHFPINAYFHPDRPEVVRPAVKGQREELIV